MEFSAYDICIYFCHISTYFLLSPCPSWHVSFEQNMSGTVLSTMECQAIGVWNSGYFPVQPANHCSKVLSEGHRGQLSPVRDQNLWDIMGDKWDLICLCFRFRKSGARPESHCGANCWVRTSFSFKPWIHVYSIFTYIWLQFMVNVGNYAMHYMGSYEALNLLQADV